MRTCVTVLFCAVSAAALLAITACKELFADIEEDFSYWASEPAITGFRSASPAQTSPAGVQCVPSASDAVITLTVHNPKNFSFIMPGTGAPADIVTFGSGIHDASGTKAPEAGTDYTLVQSAYDTLILTYKAAFLKRYEQSSANIGASIKLYSTDGRKFNQTYSFNLEANTPPPDPVPVAASDDNHIALFKTRTPDSQGKYYYVLCFKVGGLPGENVPAGVPLHSDLTHVYVSKNGGAETPCPVTLNSGGFITTDPLNTAFIAKPAVVPLDPAEAAVLSGSPQADTVPPSPWVLYLKTDVPVGGATAKYGIRLFDGKLYSARAEQSIGKRTLPDPKVFAHTGMDNTANSGVYTEAGATNASGNNDLYPPNTATYNGLSATNAIPVYSAYGEEVKLTIKKDAGTDYPAGVTVTGSAEKHSGDTVSGTASFTAGQSASVTLPSPTNGGGVAVYKVVFKATGEGFDDSIERALYYKVCREVKAVSGLNQQMWHILKEAIAHTNADGTVVVNGEIKATKHGTVDVDANWGEITVKKNLTIKKAAGASSAVINANKTIGGKQGHRIFNVESGKTLTLENLTLQGGICPVGASGGGMYIKPGAVASLTDCRIIDCVSSLGNGGAVCTQGRLSLTRGSIGGTDTWEGNQAKYGGGIYVEHNGSCTLTETKILGNYADGGTSPSSAGKGGGIYVERLGTCSLNNVTAVQLNGVHDALPNKGEGAGIYVASEGICNIAGSTKIDEGNDVYLAKHASNQSKNAKLTVTAPLTGTHTVARITPEDYTAGVTAVNAASGVSLAEYAGRFKISDQQNPSPPPSTISWKLKYNSNNTLVLKSATTVIPNTATWKTLKNAIEASTVEDGDEFVIQGTIKAIAMPDHHGAISVTKKITVKGEGANSILDANSSGINHPPTPHRIFTVENGGELTLEDITLTGGKAAGTTDDKKCGGAILVKAGCKAELTNCVVKNCEAKEAGGGIYSMGELTLDGSTIGGASASDGNKAKNGGGICLKGSAGMTLQNCIIKNNEVTDGEGGGICFDSGSYGSSEYTITGGEISSNKIKMTDSILTRSGGGLAIANMQIKVVIDSCTIEGNTIEGVSGKNPRGAGLWLGNGAQTTIKGASGIKDNKAHVIGNPANLIGTGGGIQIDGGTLTVQGSTVISGNGAKDGGGIYAQNNTTVDAEITLTNTEINSCVAEENGGGLYIKDSRLTLKNTTIGGGQLYSGTQAGVTKGNKAKNGGGIFLTGSDTAGSTMTGGKVSYNLAKDTSAAKGGGIYIEESASFTMESGNINDNKIDTGIVEDGGGVYVRGQGTGSGTHASFTLNGGTIGDNVAGFGGGVMVTAGGKFTMNNGTMSGNRANYGGGVRVDRTGLISSIFTMKNGTITGNIAYQNGKAVSVYGIFYWEGGSITGNTGSGDVIHKEPSGTFSNTSGNTAS